MLIDCIARDYREFGRLITSDQTADKLLWLILIVCSFLIGAIAYHVAIRRRLPLPSRRRLDLPGPAQEMRQTAE